MQSACILPRDWICENFSRIDVKLSFLWNSKHGIYAAVPFSANVMSWCSRNDTQIFTSAILYTNIIYLSHIDCLVVILKFYTVDVFARREKFYKPENIFKQTLINFFKCENMTSFLNYVTAMLRALFAWRSSNGEWKYL